MSKVAVVYWSGTGNTEIMANKVAEGAKAGGAEVEVFEAEGFSADKMDEFDAVAFGCPSMGDEVLEGIRRGDISASSFAFTVESDQWEKREDGSYLRTIRSISQLFDVSPVYSAAYDSTSVELAHRSLDSFKEKEKKDLAHYFEELRKSL